MSFRYIGVQPCVDILLSGRAPKTPTWLQVGVFRLYLLSVVVCAWRIAGKDLQHNSVINRRTDTVYGVNSDLKPEKDTKNQKNFTS